ncbi:MAG TPA: UDP-glucose 4-epimerase GalE [Bacteroidia bacterium]|nr:UDP-glucose 4-epimerase GalE [Bacteroidia bacterium]
MPAILVTGGAGYIGSHTLVEMLQKTDYRVISVDNYSNSLEKTYERVRSISSRSFEYLKLDLCDKNKVYETLGKLGQIDGIIHFAAYKSVPESMSDPLLYYHNNLGSLINLLSYARDNGIQKFIFSSSCSVYGNADELPVTEKSPLKTAESPYGHSKQIGEDMIRFICSNMPEFKSVLLRYFNPVGAHMSGRLGELPLNRPNNLVPIITQTAVGKNALTVFGNDYPTRDGYCVRDYIHVSDIADAHVKAMDYLLRNKNAANCEVFNLGTGNGVSVLEAITSFEKVSGKKLPYTVGGRRAGDVIAIYANNNLARQKLGWVPQYSLDDMMLSAWQWQQRLETE